MTRRSQSRSLRANCQQRPQGHTRAPPGARHHPLRQPPARVVGVLVRGYGSPWWSLTTNCCADHPGHHEGLVVGVLVQLGIPTGGAGWRVSVVSITPRSRSSRPGAEHARRAASDGLRDAVSGHVDPADSAPPSEAQRRQPRE
jgi:hypothetical protein